MTSIYEKMKHVKEELDEIMSIVDQKEMEHVSFLKQLEADNERLQIIVDDLKQELVNAGKRIEDHEARERQLREQLQTYGKKSAKRWGLFL